MPCRYTRDEIINIALSQARNPNLEVHDAPGGVVKQDAFSIQWLQDIVDFWHHLVPFSSTVKKVSLNCTANVDTIILPADFIVDVRNGYLVQTVVDDTASYQRRLRLPLQKMLNRMQAHQRASNVLYPYYYCIVGDDGADTQYQTMLVTPKPSVSTLGQLWYYALPAVLEANMKPKLPSDYMAIEYLRIRGLEWQGAFEPGTAHKFCGKIASEARAAGLLNEPEDDEMPLDELAYSKSGLWQSSYSWMGPR